MAQHAGEGSDYTDNLPLPVSASTGHWYESPTCAQCVLGAPARGPAELQYLMVHNIDTLGANVDPGLLGWHIEQGAALSFEVIARQFEDRGAAWPRDGRPRLVKPGAAFRRSGSGLSYYNSATAWIHLDRLLEAFRPGAPEFGGFR